MKSGKSKTKSANGGKIAKGKKDAVGEVLDIPKHKLEFEKFHSENGVRTVMGSIGPVHNGAVCPPFFFLQPSLTEPLFNHTSPHAPEIRL